MALRGEHTKEGIVLNVAVLIDIGVHVVHHTIDLIVEQRIGRERRGLNLPVRQQLELIGRRRVQHRHLNRARALVRLVNGKLERELRKAVAPFEPALERG